MALTSHELFEKLKQEDEIDLLEALDLRSADLVSAFSDLIEEKRSYLIEQFDYTNLEGYEEDEFEDDELS